MISRDQMVGPWQVPVSDVAVTVADYTGHAGEAMSMGERTPVAVLDGPASGRLAVAGGGDEHSRGRRQLARRSACRRTGWRPAASRAKTLRRTRRCARLAKSLAPHSGSRSPWARTRCR